MPEFLETKAEEILLIQEAFIEIAKMAVIMPAALPVFVHGLVLGVSKFATDSNLNEKIVDTKDLVDIERYAELQQQGMFSERFNENKQRFMRVYQVQKEALMKQWRNVTDEDIKSLILENKIKDNNLLSHIILKRVANNDFEEENLSQLISILALTNSLRLVSKTAAASTLSAVAEYSEGIGYCLAEQMHNLSPAALQLMVSSITELQSKALVLQVENDLHKIGSKASGLIAGQVQALAALGSFPLSVLKHAVAGAYEGASSGRGVEDATKSKEIVDIEKIISQVEQLQREEAEYQSKSRIAKLQHNLRSAREKIYSVSQENIRQIKDDWNRAYNAAMSKYDKADKEVAVSMATLLEKTPNRSSEDDQFELVYRQSLRLGQKRILQENLAILMSKADKTEHEVQEIDVLKKVLRLDELRQRTDSAAKKEVAELERELEGKKTIESKLGGYDVLRATITASSLFVKAEVYAASRTIVSTSVSAVGSLADGLFKTGKYVTSFCNKKDDIKQQEVPPAPNKVNIVPKSRVRQRPRRRCL